MKNKYDVVKYIKDAQHSTIKASDFIKEDYIEIDKDIEINKNVEIEIDKDIENNIEINKDKDIEIDEDIEIEINKNYRIDDFKFIDTDKLFAELLSNPQEEVPMVDKTKDCGDQVLSTMALKKPRKYDET